MSARDGFSLWAPAVAVAVIGSVLGVLRSPPAAEVVWDKAAHAGSYFFLSLLLARATHGGFTAPRLGPSGWAVLLATAHGAGIELVQAVIPWREASLGDVLADAVGAIAAPAALALWYALRRRGTR